MVAHDSFLKTNIKYFRELNELSQADLAHVINVSPSFIGQLERGVVENPSYKVVEVLADYFGVEAKTLFRIDLRGTQNDTQRRLRRVILNVSEIRDEFQEALLDNIVSQYMKTLSDIGFFDIQNR